MHDHNTSLDRTFIAPICPHCATAYDPKHYDFVEDRACCSNCGTLYRVGSDHIPDIPDDDPEVDISDEECAELAEFRADAKRIADQLMRETSGATYELYERRFTAACEPYIDDLDPALRDHALKIARDLGYMKNPAAMDEGFGPGVCSMTGIDEHCCPCGRHP